MQIVICRRTAHRTPQKSGHDERPGCNQQITFISANLASQTVRGPGARDGSRDRLCHRQRSIVAWLSAGAGRQVDETQVVPDLRPAPRLVRGRLMPSVTIIGAGGMLGRKLTARLVADGAVGGQAVLRLQLVDVIEAAVPSDAPMPVQSWAADLAEPGTAERIAAARPDVIFHLAAIVSGEAEADFSRGYRINLDGTLRLFEAIRLEGQRAPYVPRVVFTSSVAVFGAPLPDAIPDDLALAPLTSYGTQKAIGELLLADYSRRGFLDGIGLRLPTICIRPGAPNRAASGFFSSILREPLVGQPAVLPVADSVRHWFASPRAATGFMMHAATLDTGPLGARRTLSLPGLSATVAGMIEALRRVAGADAVRLIRREPDPAIQEIVGNWARGFDPQRALALGFKAEASFDEIIQVHLQDELAG